MQPLVRAPYLRIILLCLALLPIAACDSGDTDDERLGISGQWVGTLVNTADPTQQYPVTLTLIDTVSEVTGSGRIELPDETLAFDVTTGLFSFPDLSLTLRFDRPPQGMISGIVSEDLDVINATLTGPNEANGTIEFMLSMQRME